MRRPSFLALPLLLSAAVGAHAITVEERPLTGASPRAAATPAAPAAGGAAPDTGAGNPLWDQFQQLQQLQQQISQLQGMVEQQGFQIEKLQNDLRVRYTDLDQRLTAQQEMLQQGGAPAAAGDMAVATPAAGPAATPGSAPAAIEEEKRAYLAAYDTFRAGGPDRAIPPMLAFVKRYPNSSFTPGAYYWLGEFYLNASTPDHDAALRQFAIVLSQYPDSAKAAAALYKTAAIFDLRGRTADARQRMLELKQRYPQSPEAALADNYLKALEAASAPAAAKAPARPATPAAPAKPARAAR